MNMHTILGFDSHISERYNKNLLDVFNNLLVMGVLVEEQLFTIQTNLGSNTISSCLEQVKDTEHKINTQDLHMNDAVIHVIATNQPIASDLRLLVASVKVATDLERIGDELHRIYTLLVTHENAIEQEDNFSFEDINMLFSNLLQMLQNILNAFARLDSDKAYKVMVSERKIDKEYSNLNRIILTYIMQKPSRVDVYVDIGNVLRSLARIGDHISNIAEHLVFIITGQDVRYMRKKDVKRIIKNA